MMTKINIVHNIILFMVYVGLLAIRTYSIIITRTLRCRLLTPLCSLAIIEEINHYGCYNFIFLNLQQILIKLSLNFYK